MRVGVGELRIGGIGKELGLQETAYPGDFPAELECIRDCITQQTCIGGKKRRKLSRTFWNDSLGVPTEEVREQR